MIRHISIKNFATIEKAEIDFHSGLNTITGETGAGKSVAVEAMSLALGSRADTAYVRSGKDKAVIQMIAEDKDDEYIITREISASGKNICRINDEIVTLGHLNALCKKLADIHGQYDHQSLLNPDHHIHLVDLYQKDQILPVKEKVQHLYQSYTSLRSRLKSILEETAKNKREQDFMAYELEELQNAQLQIGEDVELEEKIELLQNSERIYENLAGAYQIASEDENAALSAIKRMSDMLMEIAPYTQELDDLSRRTNELYYELEDISSSVRDCRDTTVFSPEELDEAIERAARVVEEKSPDMPDEEKKRVAEVVGIGAVKFAELSQNRMTDYVFNWDKMLALQGDTAPYLQNSYVRVRSIFRKLDGGPLDWSAPIQLSEDAEIHLARLLARYGEVVPQVLDDCRPNVLAAYLFDLARAFHSFYEACPVLKSEGTVRHSRLALCELTARTLKHGLGLLGIQLPDRM